MAKVKITQVKSKIGSTLRQKRTLEALGLRRISHSIEKEVTKDVQGMIDAVQHLVKVEQL
ncbi:MAG: hypothetical protein RIS47_1401 [Bacteroidota bacterium]|jgi:large subunit ribosomal protein L30